MSSELDALGISWSDEQHVRNDVAIDVAVASSKQVIDDKKKLEQTWEKLDASEKKLEQLLETVDDKRVGNNYAFQLRQAETDVAKYAEELQRLQIMVEQRKNQIREQKRKELKEEERKNQPPPRQTEQATIGGGGSGSGRGFATTTTTTTSSSIKLDKEDIDLSLDNKAYSGGIIGLPLPRKQLVVNPMHVRPMGAESNVVQDYRGGEVLPSAHQVTMKNERRKSTQYLDDGDDALFAVRKAARKRKRSNADLGDVKKEDGAESGDDKSDKDDENQAGSGDDDEDDGDYNEEELERYVVLQRFAPTKVSEQVWGRLLDYQQIGLQWLVELHFRNTGGILGDEMGLGKTIQIAALLSCLHSSKLLHNPVLVVCPLTVLSQWVGELHNWAPHLRSCILHTSGTSTKSREELIRSIRGTPTVVVTTYRAIVDHTELLHIANFDYVILDEGHKIANPESATTLAVKTLIQTKHHLILTGSPIQNTLKELWSLFDFVCPGLLGNQENFTTKFDEPIKLSRNPNATAFQLQTAVECAKALRAHIGPHLLRRMKKDVNAMLPPKHERIIRCTLTDSQLSEYCALLAASEVQDLLHRSHEIKREIGHVNMRTGRARDGGLVSNIRATYTSGMKHQAFGTLQKLRLCTNHVDLWKVRVDDKAEGGTGKSMSFRSNNPVNLSGSGKLITLQKLLLHWSKTGHKVLVFSQYRMMLDILENLVDQEGYKYIRLDGNTLSKHRTSLIDRFNDDPEIFVALLTTKVGGLGVNLTGADRVVIFDPDWNPVTDEQARERAWRIGQKREVCVYRMMVQGTVEEHILHRQLAKTYVTDKVLKDPTLQRFFSVTSLADCFMLGSEYADRVPEHLKYNVVAGKVTVRDEVNRESNNIWHADEIDHTTGEKKNAENVENQFKLEDIIDDQVGEAVEDDDDKKTSDKADTKLLASLVDDSNSGLDVELDPLSRCLAASTARQTLQVAISTTYSSSTPRKNSKK